MRKTLKKTSLLLLCTALLLGFTPRITNASAIKLNKTKATIYIGDKTTLKVTGTNKHIMWTSNNKKVATVNSKGVVYAKTVGTATISAKVGAGSTGKTLKCTVTVKNKIIVPKSPIFIKLGEYEEITIKTRGLKSNESIGFIENGYYYPNENTVNFDWDDDVLIAEGHKLGSKTISIEVFEDGFPTGKEQQEITAYVLRDDSGWISWSDLKYFAEVDKYSDNEGVEYDIDSRKGISYSGIVKYSLSFILPNDIVEDTVYLTNGMDSLTSKANNIHYKMHNKQLYFSVQDLLDTNLI